jgi:hypothetical protein
VPQSEHRADAVVEHRDGNAPNLLARGPDPRPCLVHDLARHREWAVQRGEHLAQQPLVSLQRLYGDARHQLDVEGPSSPTLGVVRLPLGGAQIERKNEGDFGAVYRCFPSGPTLAGQDGVIREEGVSP